MAGSMVVPLIILGSITKLAFAVAATYRTRAWWLPGTVAIALGVVAAMHHGPVRMLGAVSIALGYAALLAAHALATARHR